MLRDLIIDVQCVYERRGKSSECEIAGAGGCKWWKILITQLLFTDDTASVADLDDKCRLVSHFF